MIRSTFEPVADQAWAWGLSTAKCRLAITVKQIDQESGGELCKIFKF